MIIISAESSCDLSSEYIHSHDVRILMHSIVTQKGQFYDGIEITGWNVIDYRKRKSKFPVSKSPKVEEYQNEFSAALEEADSIIHITPGIQAYKSYGNASYAAKNFGNAYVVDSSQISYGYGLVVMEACRLRDEGHDVQTILKKLEVYKRRIYTYMIIQDFECLNNVDKSIAKFKDVLKFIGMCPYFCIYNDRYVFKGFVFGNHLRICRDFVKKIVVKTKNFTEKMIITSKYNNREIIELNKTLVRTGGEEFRNMPIKQVSCSEICRYGENMLGMVEIV